MKSNLKKRIKNYFDNSRDNEKNRFLLGEICLANKMLMWDDVKYPFTPDHWDDYGFGVFSQGNEDGLIQYLIHHMDIPSRTFIEFGVEDYSECNTKFLLMHNNWQGLCMDGDKQSMLELRNQEIYWKYSIEAKGAFITKENINQLIMESGYSGDVGLLSVDIDGNDYWVLDAIECISPRILICEFNPLFGPEACVSIPYKADFFRTDAHYSNLYWGASLAAFNFWAENHGYRMVCISSLRNNVFFIRKDVPNNIPETSIEKAWREAMYRESRDVNGNLSFLNPIEGKTLIGDLPVIEIMTGNEIKIKTIFCD